jgi:hypothetical protein
VELSQSFTSLKNEKEKGLLLYGGGGGAGAGVGAVVFIEKNAIATSNQAMSTSISPITIIVRTAPTSINMPAVPNILSPVLTNSWRKRA